MMSSSWAASGSVWVACPRGQLQPIDPLLEGASAPQGSAAVSEAPSGSRTQGSSTCHICIVPFLYQEVEPKVANVRRGHGYPPIT